MNETRKASETMHRAAVAKTAEHYLAMQLPTFSCVHSSSPV
jgi:hypothetical protein